MIEPDLRVASSTDSVLCELVLAELRTICSRQSCFPENYSVHREELEPNGITREEFESVIRTINSEWAGILLTSNSQCMQSSGLTLQVFGVLTMLSAFLFGPMYLEAYGILSIAGLPLGLLVIFIGSYAKGAGLQALQQAKHRAVRHIQYKILDDVNKDPSRFSTWIILDPSQAASFYPKLSVQSIKSGFRVVVKRRYATSPRPTEIVPTAVPAVAVTVDEEEATDAYSTQQFEAPYATAVVEASNIILPGSVPQDLPETAYPIDKQTYTP